MATVRVHPGKSAEGRARAEKLAAKTGRPVSLLHQIEVHGGKYGTGKLRKVWTTYDTVYPPKKNPRHVTLNEAKRVLPKNRLTDVLVKRGGQVFKAKAKYDPKLGRVRVFVNPRVAKSAGCRTSNPLKVVPMTKERYEREIKPRLRSPYNLMPFAVYKRTTGRGMHMLYKDGEFIKGGSKSALKKYARREAGF